MVSILMILMTSLVALTMQTLYRATLDMTRASLIVISDSALTEVLILLSDDPLWGKNNEKLFMKTGNPDMKIAGFNPFALPAANSRFDFEDNTAYYISFDPNDPAFGTNRCFSVNNLDGDTPVPGWRPGIDVPAHTADIVVTVMEDGVVRHAEAFVMKNLSGNFQNGSRGRAIISANYFTLDSKYEPTSFHANYDDTSALGENSMEFFGLGMFSYLPGMTIPNPMTKPGLVKDPPHINILQDSIISACSDISINENPADPNSDIYQTGLEPKDIPAISISTIISDITFEPEPLPSGTYTIKDDGSGTCYLEYTSDISGDIKNYYAGDEIVPGVKYLNEPQNAGWLDISKNIQVAYDQNNETGTGNLTAKCKITLQDGTNLYAPGDGITDTDGNYSSGNVDLCYIEGKGNLYTMGTIYITGIGGEIGDDTNIETGVALYSEGDITIIHSGLTLNGLVYTRGDFIFIGYHGPAPSMPIIRSITSLSINGAIIVAGKDPNEDPGGFDPGNIIIGGVRDVNITFDDTVLEVINKYSGSGGGGGSIRTYRVVCWY